MLDPHFVFVNEIMDWSSAQGYCRENVADLATVRSDTDNLELQDLLEKQGAWIVSLHLLQDRLNESEVSGVTLRWREQSDGKVFHKEGKEARRKGEL
ncbi:Hypothetical protein SMAX5B_020019 [Scophthalmus maximus]|uniref:C-type lectin domain-containing protein n=1 Tax=Scophthalmus maximus TaxID=52904 RepID=A0A2U9B9N7_SCOMX|nr:Hypothetical protein SMAX5B_020019 [Scophthalmus maximus]